MVQMEKNIEEEIKEKIKDRITHDGFFSSSILLFKIDEKAGIFYVLAETESCVAVIERGKYVVSGNSFFIELSTGEKFYI
ncbi:hypothetical protein AFV7_gp09 [Betalipothrixvirus pezzuloense]|uniref:Uncharacterized protein n=1 Tax=Betalipothrixvirus pezzuloense TaxID=346883 RepID=A7WKM8_9VIRU|nr:hypothetical protein AFV7_gp09 [Acidianus filamentous virus 7]CAJ31628.1 conserved hypothetical protein [Acidianus filamentous virus 7]